MRNGEGTQVCAQWISTAIVLMSKRSQGNESEKEHKDPAHISDGVSRTRHSRKGERLNKKRPNCISEQVVSASVSPSTSTHRNSADDERSFALTSGVHAASGGFNRRVAQNEISPILSNASRRK